MCRRFDPGPDHLREFFPVSESICDLDDSSGRPLSVVAIDVSIACYSKFAYRNV